jgi:Na+/H+ antiporter NhaD/arsenite permease-like protein
VAASLMAVFLFTDWPRDVAALVGAAVLLLSRRLHSAHVMGFVDWPLLLMFIGLFVVNHAFETTGLAAQAVAWLGTQGVQVGAPGPLLVLGVALSNLVSNVPAVMLLLPHLQGHSAGTRWPWSAPLPATCCWWAPSPTSSWWTWRARRVCTSAGASMRGPACR